jgi:hypothetical protein
MPAECENLQAFVEGRLSKSESEAFRQHLRDWHLVGCADCAAGLVEARRAKNAHQIDPLEETDDTPF